MSDKKRILVVHNYYQIPGGEDTVVANEKKLLENHGHEVVLYHRNNSELNKMSKAKKLLLPVTTVFNPRTYREVKSIIRKKEIDIVHVHNTLNLVSSSVYYAALRCKTPVVQTIHNFRLICPGATFYRDGHICEDCVEHGMRCAVKHRCYRGSRVQTLACVISTKIHRKIGIYRKINYICLTDFNKQKLLQFKQICPERVFVKPNFVDGPKTIIPYEQRKNQFVFVGRLDKLKGIDLLLKAWKMMGTEAPKLIIFGSGPMEEWCQKYIESNNLYLVEIRGFTPNEEVREIIAVSKALILPTQWYEGFPMTIAEAFSVGTPVIGSDIGNVGDLIQNGVNGLKFEHNSAKRLAEAVRKCTVWRGSISNECLNKYLPENNYEKMMQIYSIALKIGRAEKSK